MDSPIQLHPLTNAHLDQIKKSLLVADAALAQADLAERAGIDVSAQKAQLLDSKQKLLQVKNVYFPNS